MELHVVELQDEIAEKHKDVENAKKNLESLKKQLKDVKAGGQKLFEEEKELKKKLFNIRQEANNLKKGIHFFNLFFSLETERN